MGPVEGADTILQEEKGTDVDSTSADKIKAAGGHGHGHHYTTDEHGHAPENAVMAQIIGVAILEFGVLLHRCVVVFVGSGWEVFGFVDGVTDDVVLVS